MEAVMSANLISVKELASILSVPVSWIYQRTRTGEIPFYKIGKYCRFSETEIWAWLKEQNESE
jgi:excisionase family DNA binding protein